ncbi:hypothetical protein BGZ76_008077 [Entomortierella beljakovae]|nr:hypothetical protein BGZ76_008077 [Entomortierella beljakovae]
MLVPVENVTVIPSSVSVQSKYTYAQLTSLGNYSIVYGGLLASNFKPGQTVAVTGPTGAFGASIVAVSLATGAGRVFPGVLNQGQLKEYVAQYTPRVGPVILARDEAKNVTQVEQTAGKGSSVDLVLDMLPPSAHSSCLVYCSLIDTRRATQLLAVQSVLRIFMMKNITVKDNLMYTRDAPTTLLGFVDAELLDLATIKSKEFKLDDIEVADEWAAGHQQQQEENKFSVESIQI